MLTVLSVHDLLVEDQKQTKLLLLTGDTQCAREIGGRQVAVYFRGFKIANLKSAGSKVAG